MARREKKRKRPELPGSLEILSILKGEEGPISGRELSRRLGIGSQERHAFRRQIHSLVDAGKLVKVRGGRYTLPLKLKPLEGSFRGHPEGYGFVRVEGEADIFIPRRRTMGAMDGDRVLARVEHRKRGGLLEGSVLKVVERARQTLVGRVEQERNRTYLVPDERRIAHRFRISRSNLGPARRGDLVEAKVSRFPGPGRMPEAEVLRVFGAPEDPEAAVEMVIAKYGLPVDFSPRARREAASIPQEVGREELAGREDLRGLLLFTIDGETARDFDDAVSLERLPGRGFRLGVHIADVSHYVWEGTALDREARERGYSVYFPQSAIPMLPPTLSTGICSLNPEEDRLALSLFIEFDREGRERSHRLTHSLIRSRARLTYTQVFAFLSGKGDRLPRVEGLPSALRDMEELSQMLRERRLEEGSIDFELPEAHILVDAKGVTEGILRAERNSAHMLIEEFMLAANRVVARELSSSGRPSLYRIHERPDAEKMRSFWEVLHNLGYAALGGDEPPPKALQEVLKKVKGKPEERFVNSVLLRSMKLARYSVENPGHYGLAFSQYTHFTSPIRRYPDLVVHRLLKQKEKRGELSPRAQQLKARELAALADLASERERLAEEAEREMENYLKAQFMLDKVGEELSGFISGVAPVGLFVELEDFFLEGLLRRERLPRGYRFHEEGHAYLGPGRVRLRLGDRIRVRVEEVSLARREVEFSPAELPTVQAGLPEGGLSRRGKRGWRRRRGKKI
ncbi:MAG: ribonuclease R [Nitrospinota bacterium]